MTIVNGTPVTEAFANKNGATDYFDNAPGAVELARKLGKLS
jgi:methanogenic corrinoid protein MtbC1